MGSIGGDALKAGASGAAAGSAFGPWGAVIGAGVSALGSVAGNLIQGNASKKNAEQQQKYNKEILALQNTYNLDMFNKANEWNSPVNERARLEAAGINPLQMTGDAGEAAALQSAGALGYQQPMAVNPMAGMFEHLGAVAQLENIQADTAKKNQESITETKLREEIDSKIKINEEMVRQVANTADLTAEQKRGVEIANEYIAKEKEALIHFHDSQTALNASQKESIDKMLDKNLKIADLNIQKFDYEFKVLMSEARRNNALAGVAEKDIEYYVLNKLSEEGFNVGDMLMAFVEYGDKLPDMVEDAKNVFSDSAKTLTNTKSSSLSGHHYRSRQ